MPCEIPRLYIYLLHDFFVVKSVEELDVHGAPDALCNRWTATSVRDLRIMTCRPYLEHGGVHTEGLFVDEINRNVRQVWI